MILNHVFGTLLMIGIFCQHYVYSQALRLKGWAVALENDPESHYLFNKNKFGKAYKWSVHFANVSVVAL